MSIPAADRVVTSGGEADADGLRGVVNLDATVSAARGGSREAFDDLVRATYDDTFSLALRLTGDPHDASDVAQDTYLRALRGLSRFRGEAHIATWLYRITSNSAATLRSRRRRHGHEELGADTTLAESAPDNDPSLQADATELRDRLATAIDRLSPKLRDVVILRDVRDLTHEQIATELQITESAAKVRLHRARDASALSCSMMMALSLGGPRPRRVEAIFATLPGPGAGRGMILRRADSAGSTLPSNDGGPVVLRRPSGTDSPRCGPPPQVLRELSSSGRAVPSDGPGHGRRPQRLLDRPHRSPSRRQSPGSGRRPASAPPPDQGVATERTVQRHLLRGSSSPASVPAVATGRSDRPAGARGDWRDRRRGGPRSTPSGPLSRPPSGPLSRPPSGPLSRPPSGALSRPPSGALSRPPSANLSDRPCVHGRPRCAPVPGVGPRRRRRVRASNDAGGVPRTQAERREPGGTLGGPVRTLARGRSV